jgi:solute:Na+ symporter, SSS family
MPLHELSSHLGSLLALATPENLENAPVTELKTHLGTIDYTILIVYLVFVLGIGWALKRFMRSSSDFLTSGRSIPAWITGLAFISTNLGALEVMGMAASGAKYGIATCHFYWIGAIPAMVFLGLFMMPFYYGSRARSVPEYLNLRFDERTRGFNAIAFAIMTIFASGISMYAMAKLMNIMLGWNFIFSIVMSAIIVLVYTYLGGLTSAIYNEVLQFFLIVAGLTPLVYLSLKDVGGGKFLNGWTGMKERLQDMATQHHLPADTWFRCWAYTKDASENSMGVSWIAIVMGLGFVLSFGYWCTNFLVVQRAMAANSMSAARRTPLIGAIPKMFIPILVILPGMIAMALYFKSGISGSFDLPMKPNGTEIDYDNTIPYMLVHYLPEGVLGLGITALIASFMSGMAGNVTAFNTVWTYDIYQSYIAPNKSDNHYLWMGRMATIFGIVVSMGAAYVAAQFNNIMDFLQLIFSLVNAPLFATLILGMFWKRTTKHGAFWGLVMGTGVALIHFGLTAPEKATTIFKGGWLGIVVYHYPSEMALNFWTAIYAWTVCFVATIVITLFTSRDKSDEELKGLVYSLTPHVVKDESLGWYERPWVLAIFVLSISIILNIFFW